MRLSPEFRQTFAEMRSIMEGAVVTNIAQKQEQAMGAVINRINELLKTNPVGRVKEMVAQAGLDPKLVDIATKGWKEFGDEAARLAAKVGSLDEAKAEAYAKSVRELGASIEGLQNAVGDRLIAKFEHFNYMLSNFVDKHQGQIVLRFETQVSGLEKAAEDLRAPRKIGATHPTPQNCRLMIPLRSRSDSLTFTPGPHTIGIQSNFSRCP